MRCVIEANDNAFYIRDGAGKIRSWLDEDRLRRERIPTCCLRRRERKPAGKMR
jgi:hypothetical protein